MECCERVRMGDDGLKGSRWYRLDDIQLLADNPNQGNVGGIITSIHEFGYNDVVQMWHDRAQGGNHRKRALHDLLRSGWQPGERDRAARLNDGHLEILGLDVSHLETEQEANAFGLALNNLTREGWDDPAKLAALLQDIKAVNESAFIASGYDGDKLDALLRGLNPDFQEYDESVEGEVEWHECPECGHKWPK